MFFGSALIQPAFVDEYVRVGVHRPPRAAPQCKRLAAQLSESLEMLEDALVLVAAPQHRQASLGILDDAVVALAEADLGAVVDDWHSRQRQQQRCRELDAVGVAPRHPQEAVHVVVVQQRRSGEATKGGIVPIEPARKGGRVHAPACEGLAHVVREVEVEDRVQAAGVTREPLGGARGLAEDQRIRLDLAQSTSQLDPESRIHAGDVVAPDAVHAICGQPVLGGSNQVLLHVKAAGVELRKRDDISEAAVVMGPLPEPVIVRGIAVLVDRVAEQVMATSGVIGDEVQQHPHAAAVRGLDKTNERRVAAVAWLDLEKVLVVIAVMGWALVHRAEPERVAPQRRDVVEVVADSVERAAVQSGGIAWRRQAFA